MEYVYRAGGPLSRQAVVWPLREFHQPLSREHTMRFLMLIRAVYVSEVLCRANAKTSRRSSSLPRFKLSSELSNSQS
jgi:hypothetical protein